MPDCISGGYRPGSSQCTTLRYITWTNYLYPRQIHILCGLVDEARQNLLRSLLLSVSSFHDSSNRCFTHGEGRASGRLASSRIVMQLKCGNAPNHSSAMDNLQNMSQIPAHIHDRTVQVCTDTTTVVLCVNKYADTRSNSPCKRQSGCEISAYKIF